MDLNQTLLKLVFSVMVGALIGLEREKKKQALAHNDAIGIRTDILISLFGATTILLSQLFSSLIFDISFIAMLVIGSISYGINAYNLNASNLKTVISSILVFLLGALTMLGQFQVAIVIAIIVMFVLSLENILHKTIKKISYSEIIDGGKFLIIAFIILPFLPNQSFDHQILQFFQSPIGTESDILNPYKIWFLIVIISGIDFLGYILVKLLGKHKGYGLTGMIGGFYSSTVTSLTLSDISKKHTDVKHGFIAGILLACSTSFIKMFILIRTISAELFGQVFPIMIAMFLYLLISGGIFQWYAIKTHPNSARNKHTFKLESPLHLGSAVKIAAIVIATMIIASLIARFSSLNYYYLMAGLMAFLAQDDPIIISTAAMAGAVIDLEHAKAIIIGVIFINTLQKVATMYLFGNRKLIKPLAFAMTGLFLVTGLAFLYL